MGVIAGVAPRARGWFDRGATSRRARASQAGESLVEVVVAVAIVGLALAGLVGSMGSTIRMSTVANTSAQAESEARRIAEAVRVTAVGNYPECLLGSPASTYVDIPFYNCVIGKVRAAHGWSTPAGFNTATATEVLCGVFNFNGGSQRADLTPGPPGTGGCTTTGGPAPFHRVTVTVTSSTSTPVSASVTVVMRRAAA